MLRVSRLMVMAMLMVSLSMFVGGCQQKKPVADAAVEGVAKEGAGVSSAESLDSQRMQKAGQTFLEGRTSAPLEPIYFDFDKSNVRADQRDRMERNGAYMNANAGASIRIEGNCDERGTNEYNMALGERRALAAKKYLTNLGISATRLTTISFGEEKPLLNGNDEKSWAQNRRDDFVIE